MSTAARVSAAAALAVVALLVLALPAAAHVTISPRQGPSDGFFYADFRVPHGCEGSPTTSISVQIPQGVVSIKPEVVPGWTIETREGPYEEPVVLHGQELTEGVVEVTWTGGPLDDAHLTNFGMSMKLPAGEGETLYFPVVQRCEEGETGWIQIPSTPDEELDEPAPALTLVAAPGPDAAGDEDAGEEAEEAEDGDGDGLATTALAVSVVALAGAGGAFLRTRRAA